MKKILFFLSLLFPVHLFCMEVEVIESAKMAVKKKDIETLKKLQLSKEQIDSSEILVDAGLKYPSSEIVEYLLRLGADPDIKDGGQTLIYRIVGTEKSREIVTWPSVVEGKSKAYRKIVTLLGYYGADLSVFNYDSESVTIIDPGNINITKYLFINRSKPFDMHREKFHRIQESDGREEIPFAAGFRVISSENKMLITYLSNFKESQDKAILLIDALSKREFHKNWQPCEWDFPLWTYLPLAVKDDIDRINSDEPCYLEDLFMYRVYQYLKNNKIVKDPNDLLIIERLKVNSFKDIGIDVDMFDCQKGFLFFLHQLLRQVDQGRWIVGSDKALKKIQSLVDEKDREIFVKKDTLDFLLVFSHKKILTNRVFLFQD